jgi:hypothetical protein
MRSNGAVEKSCAARLLEQMRSVVKPEAKVAVMVCSALEKILTTGFFMKLFAAWETYHHRRRANPGCMHWENQGRLKTSTGGLIF